MCRIEGRIGTVDDTAKTMKGGIKSVRIKKSRFTFGIRT